MSCCLYYQTTLFRMKKSFIIGVAMSPLLLVMGSCQKDELIPVAEAPSAVAEYLNQHFSGQSILQITKDKDGFTKTYDVILDGGITLEFNRKFEIIDIDGTTQLPDSVIPTALLDYVKEKHPENFITDWELENKHQQISLDNGLSLEFDLDGKFLRIDS